MACALKCFLVEDVRAQAISCNYSREPQPKVMVLDSAFGLPKGVKVAVALRK